jgi:hypothetical protein
MNNQENDFLDKINELTNKFYVEKGKNTIFKKKQKFDCATTIVDTLGFDNLLNKTIYIITDTNRVFIDYTLFKLYATPENYNKITDHAIFLINYCVEKYGNYETYINLDTFTVSSAERYKQIIQIFINKCIVSNSEYSTKLVKLCIYNTPKTFNIISNILLPLFDPAIKNKIVLFDKENK